MSLKKKPVVICVINLKGGVGKSTITALLARRAFANHKMDVLAIDLDPQANLSQALLRYRYPIFLSEQTPSIVELFRNYAPPSADRNSPDELAPESVAQTIQSIEGRSFQLIPSRFDFSDNLMDSVRPDPTTLSRFLSRNFRSKDLIIIDCAPTESILTKAAYHASGLVLVPVKPEFFATIGFPLLQESLTTFRRANRGHKISVAGVVINNGFYDGGNNGGPEKLRAKQEIKNESRKNNWHVFRNEIPFSRGFPKMMRGDYSYSGNAWQFYKFADEFMRHIGLIQ